MLADIFTQPQKSVIGEKEYHFEFDHASLAMLEKRTKKSPYEIYDMLLDKNHVMLGDSIALVSCAMLKHHSKDEILDFEEQLRNHPGLWHEIKESVVGAFVAPMLPPEILREIQNQTTTKKKVSTKKTLKKRNTIG